MQINISGLSQRSTIALDKFINTSNIDICAVQETLHNQSLFTNYCTFYSNTLQTDPGRGVALIIKKKFQPQTILNSDGDIIWVLITLPSGSRSMVGSVYFNPSKSNSDFENLIKNMVKAIQFRKSQGISHIIVLGDWNARHMEWGDKVSNRRGKILQNFLDNERQCNDIALIHPNGETFKSTNGGSVIDLCLMDTKLISSLMHSSIDSEVELFSGAPIRGHFPITHVLSVPQGGSKAANDSRKLSLDMEKTDWELWQKSLDQTIVKKLSKAESLFPNKKIWEVLVESIKVTNANVIPTKVSCDHSKPFWSDNLSELSEVLRQRKASMKVHQTPLNVFSYRTAKSAFSEAMLKEKNEWIRGKLEGLNVADSKLFWRRYKATFTRKSDNFIGDLNDGVKFTKQTEDKEELLFKTYFTPEGIGCKLSGDATEQTILNDYAKLIREQNKFYPFPGKLPFNQFINLNQNITMDEISKAIKDQKTTPTAFDRDGLHPKMIKHFGPCAKDLILRLCNGLFIEEKWIWDYSRVSFIKKPDKDSYTKPGSYRPITVSSYVGKIVERILEKRLRILCGLQHIIDDEQEGFCAERSTTRYLYKLIATLKEAQKKKLNAIILCIDLQKAFDSVWVPGLIVKLNKQGVEGKILRIINSFLCNRTISLCVNEYQGQLRKCSIFGLPQGSVLSPLLFIMFISDMLNLRLAPGCSEMLKGCSSFFKYADDGTVTFIHEDIGTCYSLAQEACTHISAWCERWKLQVNCAKNKTEAIILGGNPSVPLPSLKFGNEQISYVSKTKVLGVIIDENLSFKPHAKMQVKNCWFAWYTITQNTTTMRGLNVSSLSILFKSVVLTKLLYAGQVWLADNISLFTNLWSRAMLKISGAEYHPKRVVI